MNTINKSSRTLVIITIHDYPKSMNRVKYKISKNIIKDIEILWYKYNKSIQLKTYFLFEVLFISDKHYERSLYDKDIQSFKEQLNQKDFRNGSQIMSDTKSNKDKLVSIWKEIRHKHFIELLDENGIINYNVYNKKKIAISDNFKYNVSTLKEKSKIQLITSFKSIIDSTMNLINDKLAYETRYLYFPCINKFPFNKKFHSLSYDIMICIHSQELKVFQYTNRKLMNDIKSYIKKYKTNYDYDYYKDIKEIIKSNIKDFIVSVIDKKISLNEIKDNIQVVPIKLAKYLFSDFYRITKNLFIDIMIERYIKIVIQLSFDKLKKEITTNSTFDIWRTMRKKNKKIIAEELIQFRNSLKETNKYNDNEISQYEILFIKKAYKEIYNYFVSFLTNKNNLKKITVTFFIYNFSFFENNKNYWRKWYYYTKESITYLYNKKLDSSFDFLSSLLNITIPTDNETFHIALNDTIDINSILNECSPIIEEIYNESQLINQENTFTLSYIKYFFVGYYVYHYFENIISSTFYLFIVFLILFFMICQELNFNYYSHYLIYSLLDKIHFPLFTSGLKHTNPYHRLLISNLLVTNSI